MSASVCAKLVQVGGASGLTQGSLAGAVHNLSAFVRIVALYVFGRLYVAGQRIGMPSLPYSLCAATQFAACALVLALPAAQWSSSSSSRTAGQGLQAFADGWQGDDSPNRTDQNESFA